jgi:hypothetical protein
MATSYRSTGAGDTRTPTIVAQVDGEDNRSRRHLFPTNAHILLDFVVRLSKTDRTRREEAS